jgi:hypothetical protein
MSEFIEVSDERFAKRRECDLPASVFLTERGVWGSCKVRDMSATGAGIVVKGDPVGGRFSGRTLPDKFWLRLAHDGSQVCCRVAWQAQDTYGVRFVSPLQPAERPRKPKAKDVPEKKSAMFGFMRV